MSSKIDERVVNMKFNSASFQKGVAETSSALDRLKAALNIGSNNSLSNLTGEVGKVSGAFNSLETIATGALLAIGAKAVQLGQQLVTNLVTNLTSSARDGFKEYETQVNAIQTILGNTKSKGEDITSVNAALDILNTYSDKTIYNFTQMVDGVKTLTNQGAKLGTAVDAVKGFANAAALAGVGAEEMARGMEFGLNQAITKGFLGIQDFTSIQNVMGEQFKNSLMETARVHGTNVDELIAKNGSFRDSLSEGWATSEVILETLSKFTGELSDEQLVSMGYTAEQIVQIQAMAKEAVAAATKVKSWTQLLGTMAEATGSGWAKTWQLIIGDSTEATDFFTEVSDRMGVFIQASNEARNSQLKIWHDDGGRKAFIQGIWNIFDAVTKFITPIKEAFAEVFPPKLGKTLIELSNGFRDFTAGLIISDAAAANIKMVATGLFTVLKFGIDIITGVAKVVGFLISTAWNLATAIFGLITPILSFVRSFIPVSEGAENATSSVSNFFDMIVNAGKFLTGWLPEAIRNLGEQFNTFLNGGEIQSRVRNFISLMQGLGATVAMVYNVLAKGDFTGNPFFQEDSKFVDVLFRIREGIMSTVDAFKNFFGAVGDAADRSATFWDGVLNILKKVWEFVKPAVDAIGNLFQGAMGDIDWDAVLAGINVAFLVGLAVAVGKVVRAIIDAFKPIGELKKSFIGTMDELKGALARFGQESKPTQLLKIAAALLILAGALWVLSIIDPERLIGAVTAMAVSFGILLGGLAVLDKIDAEPSIKASAAITLIAFAVNILASAVAKMGALNPEQLAGGLLGIVVVMGILVLAAEALDKLENGIVRSATGILILSAAIMVMAGAVAIFGAMNPDQLSQGIGSVALMLGVLVGAAILLSKFGPTMVLSALGILAFAVALNLLVAPIIALGMLPMDILVQGMVALGIALLVMAGVAVGLSFIAPMVALASVALLAFAVALNLLVAPIIALGMIPFEVLVQGLIALTAVLLIMVVAAAAMTTAVVGAGAIVALAAGILVLSFALAILAALGLDAIMQAILGLVVALLALGLTALILLPLAPVLLILAVSMGIMGAAMIAFSVAIMIAALALMLIGPAMMLATGGLLVFAKAAPKLMEAVGPMFALGAALLVFGAGALVAGAGLLVLGLGLVVLGAGLALVGAVGVIGAFALVKVAEAVSGILVHIPGMLAMGAALLVLGAGVVVLGAGLVVLGAGLLLTGTGFLLLIPLGALLQVSIERIIKAIEKLAPMSEQIGTIGSALKKMGSAVGSLADDGLRAAAGLNSISKSFTALSSGAMGAAASMQMMSIIINTTMTTVVSSLNRAPAAFVAFSTAVVMSMTMMNAGLIAGGAKAQATAASIGRVVGAVLVVGVASSYGSVYSASVTLGDQMIAGMNRGLQNGSWQVSQMASRVAQTALTSAKRTLGVASPSKEFAKIGEWSDEGLAKGLYNNMAMVDKAGTDVGNAALNATQEALRDIKNSVMTDMDFVPTIKPVLDMSAVKQGAGQLGSMLTPPSLKVSDSYAMASSLAVQQRTQQEEAAINGSNDPDGPGRGGDTYNQYITSPKAVSQAEIYRNTKNLISVKKGETPT